MQNQEIAEIFRNIATILELKGDNPFRIRAYQKAAQNIESLSRNLKDLVVNDALQNVPGIGKDLSEKIKEIIKTGKLKRYEQLKRSIPAGLVEMLKIPGLGPKTVRLFYDKLKISNINALKKAARKGKLKGLPGIKDKIEYNILKGIELINSGKQRMPLYEAMETANRFIDFLLGLKDVAIAEVAGSLRRKRETVKDIDILVISSKPSKVMDSFVKFDNVKKIIVKGPTKSSVMAKQGIQVDLRIVDKESFGSALMYFTGSKDFNITLRQFAVRRGYKINEYGIFKINNSKETKIAGETEEEIFDLFNMQHIPATLRENRGEFELALKHNLPGIIDISDLKGDFHVHSKYSDGKNSLPELAKIGKEKGYQYMGICDHSQSLRVANGLDKKAVFKKINEINRINKKFSDFILLAGSEVDILSDGSLDYPDKILKEFDLVIAAIHSGFKQSKKQLTSRIISAVKNKHVNIIAHPTGRLFGARPPYEIEIDEILSACLDYNVAMEINSYPQRLDLNDINCRKAKEKRVKLAIGTDAHILHELDLVKLGVFTAQRGWLEKDDIINTLEVEDLLKWLHKK